MLVDVRPAARLRGTDPIDLATTLGPVVDALGQDSVDLARARVVCDWIQYRENFREVVDLRKVGEHGVEIALDLRRAGGADGADLAAATKRALAGPERTYLERWVPGSESVIWRFNALYWRALSDWELATGVHYDQRLPGGSSDGTNVDAARALIRELFDTWDELMLRGELPDELYVLEIGVGDGSQARVWLDAFREMDAGRGYYRRLHYLLGDYSPHALEVARAAVADHGDHVSTHVVDARDPSATLDFLRNKAFLVYLSNVYDNLPTDELAWIGGQAYRVEVRAYLPGPDARRIAAEIGRRPAELPGLLDLLLREGPDGLAGSAPGTFASTDAAVRFWQECWSALRLAERYVPLAGLDHYEVAPAVSGNVLRPVLTGGGDIRMHASNGAVASFAHTLPLLHPHGRLHCHDLFVTDTGRYGTAFSGPGKYDGSVVNWVNGAVLRQVARGQGFEVTYEKFTHRKRTNITTLVARHS